ncbi:fibronectin type III domain-containing protein, partial [Aetokthonos hydrillicola]|uniref:fibronectin type III domain-containing protein n=1 Tax=Aetokthonos hydrillicola TaxID=1550245 RepID=UPI0030DA92FB
MSNIAQTTVELNLMPPSVGSAPVSYSVYYSTTNTPPTPTTASMVSNITGFPYTLSGLAPTTTYYLWVRSKCSATDSSSWSTPAVKFTTLCNTVTAFNENFDGVTTPNLPNCWGKLLRGTTLSIYADVATTTDFSYSGLNAVEIYNSSSGANDDIMLVSPIVSNIGAGTHRLKFYAKNDNASQYVQVGTLSDVSATGVFTPLATVDINTTFQEYTVDFTSYTGTDPYIAIRRLSTSIYTSVYIDNIIWEPIPPCDLPTALTASQATATTAQLGWTAPTNGSPTSYSVYYSTSSTAPAVLGAPSVSGITGTTVGLASLTPSTTYYVWVRTKCSATDSSNWAGPISFKTTCLAATAFNENFDGVTAPN